MKSIITPVLDNAGIIGFIVEYMPDYVEAYFDGELLGSFSSKAEAAAELLLHTERVPPRPRLDSPPTSPIFPPMLTRPRTWICRTLWIRYAKRQELSGLGEP